ncbi:hypothetical protein ACFSL6_18950 [Paenibacillus thailandensis]|uniref:DUF4375 domain-containing protein n=1 Tax=Paenibacillus thailandensis TaxID=393250 RepID=A0ABW5QS50_9BACL
MRVRLDGSDLNDSRLSWLCVAPFLEPLRGKSEAQKASVYRNLNEGQKALWMFYIYHNHARSEAECYWFAYYFIAELPAWDEIKKASLFFNRPELCRVYEGLEEAVRAVNGPAADGWRKATASDLDADPVLRQTIVSLYERYRTESTAMIEAMNGYVRANEGQFIEA